MEAQETQSARMVLQFIAMVTSLVMTGQEQINLIKIWLNNVQGAIASLSPATAEPKQATKNTYAGAIAAGVAILKSIARISTAAIAGAKSTTIKLKSKRRID